MREPRASKRDAFTLLEMVLALAIGMLLMVGLYFTLNMHLSGADSTREQVDQAQVARAILRQMSNDIKDHLATLDVYPTPSNAKKASTTTTEEGGGPYPFNLGVTGDTDWLALYVSKVPRSTTQQQNLDGMARGPDEQALDSDLRRIVYWLVPNNDGTGGLARQEVKMVTSDDEINLMPPGIPDEQSMVFANQVVALSFEYFDGTQWLPSWDGTEVGADGVTPLGPPVAIAINLSISRSETPNADSDDPGVLEFRHVVQIPTASYHGNQTSGGGGLP